MRLGNGIRDSLINREEISGIQGGKTLYLPEKQRGTPNTEELSEV